MRNWTDWKLQYTVLKHKKCISFLLCIPEYSKQHNFISKETVSLKLWQEKKEPKFNRISYQDRVFMCTYSCSKPLVGLELSLSFNIIDAHIKITYKGCEGERSTI